MRKFLLFLFILPVSLNAQITFPAPDAKWHYAKYTFSSANIYNEQVTANTNTVVLGRPCKEFAGLRAYNYCGGMGPTYVYTSNDSVYFFNSTTQNQWQLLYNFSAAAGQSWTIHPELNGYVDTVTVTVDSVKTVTINAVSLKALYVNYLQVFYTMSGSYTHNYKSVIYDRIGDIKYLLNYEPDLNGTGVCDDGPLRFLCYEDSLLGLYAGDTLPCNYTNVGIAEHTSDALNIFPNPASESILISGAGSGKAELTDLAGRIVLEGESRMDVSALPAGVYFLRVHTVRGIVNRKISICR